jgi:hypothetical protein
VYRPYRKIDSYTRQLSSLYTAMLTQRAVYEDLHGKRELAWRYLQRAYEIDPNARTRQTLEEYSSTAAENK